jgi:hypothetical protein
MARGLAAVVNVLDPDVIVLGGGMSNVDRLYANVPRLWAPYVFSDVVTTRLVKAAHGDSSGVRGAAWLWRALSLCLQAFGTCQRLEQFAKRGLHWSTEERRHALARPRRREQITLPQLAADGLELGELHVGLDAFGHDLEAPAASRGR